ECLIQAGPGARGAGQAAIHIDPLRSDPQFLENPLLRGEVLFVGGAAGIAHKCCCHVIKCTLSLPSMQKISYHLNETCSRQLLSAGASETWRVRWTIRLRTHMDGRWSGLHGSGATPCTGSGRMHRGRAPAGHGALCGAPTPPR